MLAELRTKSQVTIPKELVVKLGIQEGDKLEITEHDGVIHIMPVVVYSKKTVNEFRAQVDEVKERIRNGEQPVFDNIESLLNELGAD